MNVMMLKWTTCISQCKYSKIQELTKSEMSVLYSVILSSWPDLMSEPSVEVRNVLDSTDQLSVLDGIIYKGLQL